MTDSVFNSLAGRRVLVGVTGGIAAYKSVELVRLLRKAGAEVRVVMTEGAAEFVTAMTLQAVSGHPVRQALFDPAHEAAMGHIELARWADLILVAPATASFMARLAHGFADTLLSTLCLASAAPLVLAPAMNQQMWAHPATQDNLALLQQRGVRILGPDSGDQACGEVGPGRMMEPEALLRELVTGAAVLQGVRVLLTAGPTREPLDPVRFIGNRSSGKMGFALASAFLAAGASVTLVAGPVALETPVGVERVDVETALEMEAAVMSRAADCDLFVGCAAVADYRPAEVAAQKIKKDGSNTEMSIHLVRNPDILAAVAALPQAPFTVGFAAETESHEAHAEKKRLAKGVDMIAANRVGDAAGGFERDENALTVLWAGGRVELSLCEKRELARQLVSLIAERYEERDTA